MSYETIMYEKRGRVAYIRLNRPNALNAINAPMARDLDDAFEDFDRDDDVWVAVLSGEGRCFCAGADVKALAESTSGEGGGFDSLHSRKDGGFMRSSNYKPVIAAVHGYCYGSALGFALDADLLVATEDARFAITQVQMGLGAGFFGVQMTYFGCGKIGTELALTGRDLSGTEAYRLGLVNKIVPTKEELDRAADEMAQTILRVPPLGVRENVMAARHAKNVTTGLARLPERAQYLSETQDHAEATRAFIEKREPVFRGV